MDPRALAAHHGGDLDWRVWIYRLRSRRKKMNVARQ